MLGYTGTFILLKQVCETIKSVSSLEYSLESIEKLQIFPLLDINPLNPSMGTLIDPVQNCKNFSSSELLNLAKISCESLRRSSTPKNRKDESKDIHKLYPATKYEEIL